jgi:protein-tyrosine phosphatase
VKDVFWIDSRNGRTGLAIVMRPRDEWLEDDLRKIQREGIETIISMLEAWEAKSLGLASEGAFCHELGLRFVSYPIADRSAPSDRGGFEAFVSGLANRLQTGEKIGVHCRGCIGRSTIVAACALVKLGWTAREALAAIEAARGCMVPDTEEQVEFILDFGLSNGRP